MAIKASAKVWLFLIPILAIILFLFFYSRIGWTRYRSEKGFSINYPSGWFIRAIGTNPIPYQDGREYLISISDKEAHPETPGPNFTYGGNLIIFIVSFPKKGVGAAEALATGNFNDLEKAGNKPQRATTLIDNKKTFMLKYENTGFGTLDREYWIEGEKLVYEISSSVFRRKNSLVSSYYDLLAQKIVKSLQVF